MIPEELVAEIKKIVGIEDESLLLIRIRYDHMVSLGSEEKYSVYVQTNEKGYITAIDSDAFIEDKSFWIKIDEGTGEIYHFAKNQYCKYGLISADGTYNYRLVRGKAVFMPEVPVSPAPTIEERISDLETAICDILEMLAEI